MSEAKSSAQTPFDIERARLEQERQLKEKELTLRERELELEHRKSWMERWSAPAVVAIVAGFTGIAGTIFSSSQNRALEREKHEATLILEAIKTTGTPLEKEKQTAANLVFLADAGLITKIRKAQVDQLRAKAQGAGPSLPARGVEFQRSSSLTAELESKLQSSLAAYQTWLAGIGYRPEVGAEPVTVRVDEDNSTNAYFDGKSVALGANLAWDPEYALSEYTWHVLKQTNPGAFQDLWQNSGLHSQAFAHALKFYFTCSYRDDPLVGKNYYTLAGQEPPPGRPQGYLFDLGSLKVFDEHGGGLEATEPHHVGEIWGGALWELREKLGREKADRVVLAAWKRLRDTPKDVNARFFVEAVVRAAEAEGVGQDTVLVRQAFTERRLR
jgi:hypothetical protein